MTAHVGEPATDLLGGRYELGSLLGSGGMADVHAARDHLLDRDVAIKFFRPLDDRADRARFVGEARLLAGLSHPGLVTVYDASFEEQRRPYLIMRLVDGGTLRRLISDEGPLDPGDVARLGIRLATALAHVHASGVVHRDIKPSNVLLDSAGEYYLADFGLAWAMGSTRLTNSGEMVGTAHYLAPEQVTGSAVGPGADVYALGLVLLECLTGRTEYEGSDVEVAVARLSRPPSVPEGFGSAWARLLGAMTAYQPGARPDATECARRLRAIAHAPPSTRDPDTDRVDVRDAAPDPLRTGTGAVAGAATGSGARSTPPRPAGRSTPRTTRAALARARRVSKLRLALGAAGVAGAALTALMLATPAGTAGEPVPGSTPGKTDTVPAQRDSGLREDGTTPADKPPARTAAESPQPGRDAKPKTKAAEPAPATATATATDDKPGRDAEAQARGKGKGKGKPGTNSGKPAKPG